MTSTAVRPTDAAGTMTLELGMPHLGRHNLSESSLFKVLGNERWQTIQSLGSVLTSQIHDDLGSRLYATFFFLEVHFLPEKPLSAFGENQTASFNWDLSHSTKVYLDGKYRIADDERLWIRASNVFIYQERGPSKLSLAVPANLDFSRIPELPSQPDSLSLCREARSRGVFTDADPADIELLDAGREFMYQIDADRDLNGAGLVYFANFISFLDLAERRILSAESDPVPTSLLDDRSTYYRRIGYYGNAQASDCLRIALKARMRVRETPNGRVLDFGFDHRVRRTSDEKEILISSCRKVSPLRAGSDEERWVAQRMK